MGKAVLAGFWLLLSVAVAKAQPALVRRAAQELVAFVQTRFAREVAEEGIERLEPRLIRLIETWGDDAVVAVRRVGPRLGLETIERHGAVGVKLLSRWGDDGARLLALEGDTVARLYGQYGDDLVRAMLRHPGSAARVVDALGAAGLRAGAGLSAEGAAQLAAVGPAVRASGRAREIRAVVERYGDRACAFLWRNKGVLFGGAMLATFLANPEPYISGAKQLVVEPAKEIGAEVARSVDGSLVVVSGLILIAFVIIVRIFVRRRSRA